MVVNEQKKHFGKFNIIDIFIAVFVIICLTAVVMRYSGNLLDFQSKPVTVRYTYFLTGLREQSCDALSRGGEIYARIGGVEPMGTIVQVDIGPNDEYALREDGIYVRSFVPERYDVTVTIETNGKIREGAIYSEGDEKLEAGSHLYLFTKWVACGGIIKSVTIVD